MKLAEKLINLFEGEANKKLGVLKSQKTKLQKKLKNTGKNLGDGNFSDDIATHIQIFKTMIEIHKLQAQTSSDAASHNEQIKRYEDKIKQYQSKK
jgi:hypothetical protein